MGVKQRVAGIADQVNTIRFGLRVVVVVELVTRQNRQPVSVAGDVDGCIVCNGEGVGRSSVAVARHVIGGIALELDGDVVQCRRCDQDAVTVTLDDRWVGRVVIDRLGIRIHRSISRDALQIGQCGIGDCEVSQSQVSHWFEKIERDVKSRTRCAVVPCGSRGQGGTVHSRPRVVQRVNLTVDGRSQTGRRNV